MKRNVLLVAERFAPEDHVAAQRPTKLAKYLTRAGYEVTVLTCHSANARAEQLSDDLRECGRVLRAPRVTASSVLSRLLRRPHRKAPLPASGREPALPEQERQTPLRALMRGVASLMRLRRQNVNFYRAVWGYAQRAGLDLSHFDVMISTCPDFSAHMVAWSLREKCPTVEWICDYRSPDALSYPALLRGYFKRWERRLLPSCDCVVAASTAELAALTRRLGVHGTCIPDGFDPEDAPPLEEQGEESGPFTVLFAGSLRQAEQQADVIVRAFSDILRAGRIRRDHLRLSYCGSRATAEHFSRLVEELELEPIYRDYGRVTQREARRLKQSAQALVCFCGTDGVRLPHSLFEALLLQKPVIGISLCAGGKSELSTAIRALRIGCCYEAADGEASYERLKKYISESCTYFLARRRQLYEPDEKKCAQLAYPGLISRWIQTIEQQF